MQLNVSILVITSSVSKQTIAEKIKTTKIRKQEN